MTWRTANALLIAIAVLGSAAPSASGEAPPSFADWTTISANTASGTLLGAPVSLSGTHVFNPPVSTLDGSAPFFADGTIFTPGIVSGDAIQIGAPSSPGSAYKLTFGAPVTDPRLHVFSLGSRLDFPTGTRIARVSGEPNFTVSGASVIGNAVSDSSGTVKLVGSFTTITFTAVQLGLFAGEDGIILQVGVPAPPPPLPASLVARVTVSPNPTCVGSPTILDASGSNAGAGGPIRTYAFSYTETDLLGHPRPMPTALASSASPTASFQFPWSHPTRAAAAPATTTQPATLSLMVREPATVVLTITDAAGVTASASAEVRFAQTVSTGSRAGCPAAESTSGGPGNAASRPKVGGPGPLMGGRVVVPLGCPRGATRLGCVGTVVASVASFAKEIRRQRLIRQLEQIHDHLADIDGRTRADELLLREHRLNQLQVIQRQLDRLEQLQRALLCAELAREFCAFAAASPPRRIDVLAATPFQLAAGQDTAVGLRLSGRAARALRRYHRLRVWLTVYTVAPTGARAARSRRVTLTAPGG